MIVIFSSGILDKSTDKVIDWFVSKNINYIKITPISIVHNQIQIIDQKIYLYNSNNKTELKPNDVSCIWLRKWNIDNEVNYILKNKQLDSLQRKSITSLLISEVEAISKFIFWCLKDTHWIPNLTSFNSNKLVHAFEAKNVGLKIPKSTVTGLKSEINLFIKNSDNITKLINTHFSYSHEGNNYHSYTTSLTNTQISNTFPSLIQENIKKKFEIRSFFLEGDIYSFAIFSQGISQTELDYRRYDYSQPSKIVPYQFDNSTEEKIRKLYENLNLNTGSSDFIINENQELYFLEINPFGQFGLLSKKCNSFLEKKIAEKLIQYEQKNKS